ncbi:MAG: TetR/AcrR family transcriptional regulator [Gammaproteobacteria bacterium]|nr:TetR/AcrR family transcriptional regulator [Gammaproteobacteria bacterium]
MKRGAKPPIRLAREQRFGDILRAARKVFCEKGYDQAAVAEIAARLGVVEGTVYKYFDSKRELLHKVLEHWYEEMLGDYARDLAAVVGARARLRLLVWRHLRSVREHPQLCRLMFREVRAEQDYRGSRVHAMNRRYTQFLIEVLRDGVAAGEFRAEIPHALVRDMIYGGIEHHAWNHLCGRGDLDIDRIADRIAAVVCDGLAARAPAADLHLETEKLARIAARIERSLPQHRARK